MKVILALAILSLSICFAGCTSIPVAHVSMAPASGQGQVVMQDSRVSASTGLYALAEGDVYTCWYGIKQMDEDVIDPPRMELLRDFLAGQLLVDGKPHQVVVTRFDIYWNRQDILEDHANSNLVAPPGTGVIGQATVGALAALNSPHGALIGCPGAARGEYHLSESPDPDSAPVVTYLTLTIDGAAYSLRSLYAFEAGPIESGPHNADGWADAAEPALKKAFADLADLYHHPAAPAAAP